MAVFHGRLESVRTLLRLIRDVRLVREETKEVAPPSPVPAAAVEVVPSAVVDGAGDKEGAASTKPAPSAAVVVAGQSEESIQQSSDLLVDMYLNSPDKGVYLCVLMYCYLCM